MESTAQAPDVHRIERLMAEMALTFNWISLYQAGHPSLAGRVEKLHRDLAAIAAEEPSGHLLLGIAMDKILYQNAFLGNGNSLVRNLTSEFFLQQVATLDFSGEVTPKELLFFFHSLQRLRAEKGGGKFDEILKGEGVRGRINCGTDLPMIVAFEHHIKHDRTGYPKVRTREPLHIASHMTQIADVYDALRSHRPYRPSIELETTLSIMKEGRGTEFEPRLFDGFVGMLS